MTASCGRVWPGVVIRGVAAPQQANAEGNFIIPFLLPDAYTVRVQRPPDTLRVIPFRSPNIHRHSAPQVNTTLVRNFSPGEKRKFQVKVSAFNVSNTPLFNRPNTSPTSPLFGVVSPTLYNLARSVELAFRFAFQSKCGIL